MASTAAEFATNCTASLISNRPLIASFALPFVTADLARSTDGTWRLIELGDGQVSDRPATTDADSFLSALLPRAEGPLQLRGEDLAADRRPHQLDAAGDGRQPEPFGPVRRRLP